MIIKFRVRDRGFYQPTKIYVFLLTDLPDHVVFGHGLTVGKKFQWTALSIQAKRLFFSVVATGREGTTMTVDLRTTKFDW